MILSILGVCGLRIGWVLTVFRIPQFHTLEMLYFSYPISWVITFAFQLLAFAIFYRRMQKNSVTL